jgi:amidase
MARCPKDLATLLSVQSGQDARQPHGLPTADFGKDMDAHALKGAKIAWLGDWGLPFDDGIMDISERAVEDLRALGADVTAIDAPFSMDALWESWITLRSWMVASGAGVFYDDPEKRDLLKPAAIWEIERGFAMSAREVHQQSVMRSMWFKEAAQLFQTYDALLMRANGYLSPLDAGCDPSGAYWFACCKPADWVWCDGIVRRPAIDRWSRTGR